MIRMKKTAYGKVVRRENGMRQRLGQGQEEGCGPWTSRAPTAVQLHGLVLQENRQPTPSSQNCEYNIKQIGTFASVEQFLRFYRHIVRPRDLTGHSDLHLFKKGIKPMWEDDANKNGGKWIIRLWKGLAFHCRETHPGHARGTVHGCGADLWGCDHCPGSGGHYFRME